MADIDAIQKEIDLECERYLKEQKVRDAAPDLLKACQEQCNAIDILCAMLIESKPGFFPSKSGKPWEAIAKGRAAIDKATK